MADPEELAPGQAGGADDYGDGDMVVLKCRHPPVYYDHHEEGEEGEEDEEEEELPPDSADLLNPDNYPFSEKVDPDAGAWVRARHGNAALHHCAHHTARTTVHTREGSVAAPPHPYADKTGCEAYRATEHARIRARELTDQGQFFMFPIESRRAKLRPPTVARRPPQFHCEVLDLKHSGLGDKGAAALARKVLSLVDNWISARGRRRDGASAAPLLSHAGSGSQPRTGDTSNSRIIKLDLSENRLGYRAGSMGHDEDIGEVLKKLLCCKASQWDNGPMRHLILRANYIGDTDMKKITESLHDNNWLTELDVSYNELGPTRATVPAPPTASPTAADESSTSVLVLVVIAVLILVCLAGLAWMMKPSKAPPEEEEN
eukprot:gene19448-53205_t